MTPTEHQKRRILVTGGHGFLGQHVVRLLQAHRSDAYIIRILDIAPRRHGVWLSHSTTSTTTTPTSTNPDPNDNTDDCLCPVETVIGDLCDYPTLLRAMTGVDCVIHCAASVDFWRRPRSYVYRVNVEGTQSIIRACLECGVPHLVFTSTLSVAVPSEGVENGPEDQPYPAAIGKKYLYGLYAETKAKAEQAVLAANGLGKAPGKPGLTTCVVRALCLYGENDPWQITNLVGSSLLGYVMRFGGRTAKSQTAYVANCAWGHILAAEKLMEGPGSIAEGKVYIPTDETPIQNYFDTHKPFLEAMGLRVVNWWIPYSLGYLIACTLETALWFLRPLVAMNTTFNRISCDVVTRDFYFKSDRARQELGYKPLYSYQETLRRYIAHIRAYGRIIYTGPFLFSLNPQCPKLLN